ncbi:MAG TPA: hypothetical protein VNA16_05085, partial [Abditibacteriaceae bacterium]|nr:hypothetical protein [Abditibacteriaceae bacterium]
MQTRKLHERTVKLGTITALGMIAIAPLVGMSTMAQAAPPDHAPAHGRRAKDKKDKKHKDKHDRHDRGGHRGDRDDRDDDRDDNDYHPPHHDGDHHHDNNDGHHDGNQDGIHHVEFDGRVISVQSRTRITVRGDGGRTYTVISRTQLPTSINAGDRVRVIGNANRNAVRAASVRLVRNGGGAGGAQGQAVNFQGRVLSI